MNFPAMKVILAWHNDLTQIFALSLSPQHQQAHANKHAWPLTSISVLWWHLTPSAIANPV